MVERIGEFCERHDLPWDDRRREAITTYLDLLEKFNESMNLVGPMSRREMVDELILDSLAVAALRLPSGRALDVGTGAGLPGLPLAVVAAGAEWTLVEPRRKRTTFLKIARQRLELDGVAIERQRLEELDDFGFDFVVSKAFQPPAEWLGSAVPFRADGGVIVCMTGPNSGETVRDAADDHGLQVLEGIEDTTKLGVPETDRTRQIYVVGS